MKSPGFEPKETNNQEGTVTPIIVPLADMPVAGSSCSPSQVGLVFQAADVTPTVQEKCINGTWRQFVGGVMVTTGTPPASRSVHNPQPDSTKYVCDAVPCSTGPRNRRLYRNL